MEKLPNQFDSFLTTLNQFRYRLKSIQSSNDSMIDQKCQEILSNKVEANEINQNINSDVNDVSKLISDKQVFIELENILESFSSETKDLYEFLEKENSNLQRIRSLLFKFGLAELLQDYERMISKFFGEGELKTLIDRSSENLDHVNANFEDFYSRDEILTLLKQGNDIHKSINSKTFNANYLISLLESRKKEVIHEEKNESKSKKVNIPGATNSSKKSKNNSIFFQFPPQSDEDFIEENLEKIDSNVYDEYLVPYNNILEECQASNQPFYDENFPPVESSMSLDMKEFDVGHEITWFRARELFGEKMTFCEHMEPINIEQGDVGDCFLITALTAIADRKNLIKRLFASTKINPLGCYSVWLCDSGEWKNIVIDDHIAAYFSEEGRFKPIFADYKNEPEIWVSLVEKAYAKMLKNYHSLDGGHQSDALIALTGAPSKDFEIDEDSKVEPKLQMWNFIEEALKNNFIVTAASKEEEEEYSDEDSYEEETKKDKKKTKMDIEKPKDQLNRSRSSSSSRKTGIEPDHAYSIIKTAEVYTKKKKVKLIQMRDPWGEHEWKIGEWSTDSPNWTPEVIKSINYIPQDDQGLFWLSLEEFENHFDCITNCQVHEDFVYSWIKLGEPSKKNNYFVIQMKVHEDGLGYITAHQKFEDHFRDKPEYTYSDLRMMICEVEQHDVTKIKRFVKGKYKAEQSCTIKSEFKKGVYIIMIEILWAQDIYYSFNLASYSASKIDFFEKPIPNETEINTIYAEMFRSFLRTKHKAIESSKYKKNKNKKYDITQLEAEKFGLFGFMIRNSELNLAITSEVHFDDMKNMEIIYPSSKKNKVILKVLPGQEEIILLKETCISNEDESISISYDYEEDYEIKGSYSRDELIQLCKSKGDIEFYIQNKVVKYNFRYDGGEADFITNETDSYVSAKLKLTNACNNVIINGKHNNEMEILIKPKDSFLFDLQKKNALKKEGSFSKFYEIKVMN